jgi:XTP/dITP diphosphohydrolase
MKEPLDPKPPRRFTEDTLVVATHNEGKLSELRPLLEPLGIKILSAKDMDLPEPDETEGTFVGNAVLKSRAAARCSGYTALADDSGLSVETLCGAPGVHSARWAINRDHPDAPRDFDIAMERVHREMGNSENRKAQFVCSIALSWPDGHDEYVEGTIDGTIVWPPRGDKGFGYDPIFMPDGHDRTFAEMEAAEKEQISHRRNAIEKILEKCFR